ncbi:MAG: 5-formyltetrahydrofolate cyclo-ligase, partial [Candidatus Caenarcaniphilales bacterium]|nr:5-formyltetrahydrofolate cyclo-ligase [Candidatus Caenarcaniphilales bacterium]
LLFDLKGYRLGKGKGYYDKLIARLSKSTKTLGIIPEHFLVNKLEPLDSWDEPVKVIATEKRILEI